MKKLLTVASTLALTTGLLTAHSQAPATAPTKIPDQRAATYQGPKVVKDSKALGKRMVQKSKPTDMRIPVIAPVKVK